VRKVIEKLSWKRLVACSSFVILFPEEWRSREEGIPSSVIQELEKYWYDSTEEDKLAILYCKDNDAIFVIAIENLDGLQRLVIYTVAVNVEEIRNALHI